MIGKIDTYAPCFCGSGKKYRFCCMSHLNISPGALAAQWQKLDHTEEERCGALFQKGYKLLEEQKIAEAIPEFEKALPVAAVNSSPVNNLALCHLLQGNVDKAKEILQKNVTKSLIPNVFGLAMLSQMLYMEGEDAAGLNAAYVAANLRYQTPSSVTKVCESLSMFQQHRSILDFLGNSEEEQEEQTHFFAAVAAANLGKFSRAIAELETISLGSPVSSQAMEYLRLLRENKTPDAPRGGWPYYDPRSQFHFVTDQQQEQFLQKVMNSGWLTDMAESILMGAPQRGQGLEILRTSTHPSVEPFLKAVVKWPSAGKDARMTALGILSSRGLVDGAESSELLKQSGRKEYQNADLVFNRVRFDPEFHEAEEFLPAEELENYDKWSRENHSEGADMVRQLVEIRRLVAAAPKFYPFRFNEASILLRMNQVDAAEKIIRELRKEHPAYPFATYGLMYILISQEKLEEAKEVMQQFQWPAVMHPDAGAAVFCSFAKYFIVMGQFKEAKGYLDMVKEIAPENPNYKDMQAFYEKMKKLHGLWKKAKTMSKPQKKTAGKK